MAAITFNITDNFPVSGFVPDVAVDPDVYLAYSISIRVFVTGVISAFGMTTNVINIVIFYRQGLLSDSSTASLVCLAMSDFFNCFFVFWGSGCYGFLRFNGASVLNMSFTRICWLTSDRPTLLFSQITCCITAYISFERCVSVVFPFKVKLLFNAKKAYVVLTVICLITVGLNSLILFNGYLSWIERYPNSSLYLDVIDINELVPLLSRITMVEQTVRIMCVLIVVLCNIVILFKLKRSRKFRKTVSGVTSKSEDSSSTSKQENEKSAKGQKDMKVLRMITVICILFLICYGLDIFLVFLTQLDIGFTYSWLTMGMFYTSNTFLTTVNASGNILIYYTMSTRYREELRLYMFKEVRG